MKKAMLKMLLAFMLVTGTVISTYAQHFYVKVRPTATVAVKRPPAPHKGYVWVSGDYTWTNNAYVWKEGYWIAPPKARAVWVPGHWAHEKGYGSFFWFNNVKLF